MSQAETGEYQYELPDDVENAEHEFGGGYLYRPRQLLIQEQDLDLVLAALNHHEVQLNGRPERVERTRFSVQRTASRERRRRGAPVPRQPCQHARWRRRAPRVR